MGSLNLYEQKKDAIYKWIAENGLSDFGGASIAELCSGVGISERAYYSWQANRAEFAELIKSAKEEFKSTLEKDLVTTLARSAKGYTTTKKRTEYKPNKDGSPKIEKQIIEETNVPPNTGAAIFLLTNINSERWKNRNQQSVEAKIETKTEERIDLSDEAIERIADILQDEDEQKLKGDERRDT